MDPSAKKTALRMIPYGLYVLTAEGKDGSIAAAAINWVTQASFEPPLVVLGVKTDSAAHAIVQDRGVFALNILGKGQQDIAFKFFKPATRDGNTIAGEPFRSGVNGAPVLERVPAAVECTLLEVVKRGDHSIFVGEVTNAVVTEAPQGRPDDAVLAMRDLGEKIFYGG
jgi:flavin reductase (DIM6/NTAB) family NADH-FMN oxidoreductase RutF